MAESKKLVSRQALVRFLVLGTLLIAGFVFVHWARGQGWLELEFVRGQLEALRSAWWSPLALIGLYLLLSPLGFPVTPLIFAGGVVFGTLLGGLYNVAGTWLAALLSFAVARMLGRTFIAELVGEKRAAKIDGVLERHSFWPLVTVRYLPIPFPVINYGAALAGVTFRTFAITSFLGLLPGIFIYTYFWSSLADVAQEGRGDVFRNLFVAIGLLAVFNLLPAIFGKKSKKPDEVSSDSTGA